MATWCFLIHKHVAPELRDVLAEIRNISARFKNLNQILPCTRVFALEGCIYQGTDVSLLNMLYVQYTSQVIFNCRWGFLENILTLLMFTDKFNKTIDKITFSEDWYWLQMLNINIINYNLPFHLWEKFWCICNRLLSLLRHIKHLIVSSSRWHSMVS